MRQCQISILDWVTNSGELQVIWCEGDDEEIVGGVVGLSQQEWCRVVTPGPRPGSHWPQADQVTPSCGVGGGQHSLSETLELFTSDSAFIRTFHGENDHHRPLQTLALKHYYTIIICRPDWLLLWRDSVLHHSIQFSIL